MHLIKPGFRPTCFKKGCQGKLRPTLLSKLLDFIRLGQPSSNRRLAIIREASSRGSPRDTTQLREKEGGEGRRNNESQNLLFASFAANPTARAAELC